MQRGWGRPRSTAPRGGIPGLRFKLLHPRPPCLCMPRHGVSYSWTPAERGEEGKEHTGELYVLGAGISMHSPLALTALFLRLPAFSALRQRPEFAFRWVVRVRATRELGHAGRFNLAIVGPMNNGCCYRHACENAPPPQTFIYRLVEKGCCGNFHYGGGCDRRELWSGKDFGFLFVGFARGRNRVGRFVLV